MVTSCIPYTHTYQTPCTLTSNRTTTNILSCNKSFVETGNSIFKKGQCSCIHKYGIQLTVFIHKVYKIEDIYISWMLDVATETVYNRTYQTTHQTQFSVNCTLSSYFQLLPFILASSGQRCTYSVMPWHSNFSSYI